MANIINVGGAAGLTKVTKTSFAVGDDMSSFVNAILNGGTCYYYPKNITANSYCGSVNIDIYVSQTDIQICASQSGTTAPIVIISTSTKLIKSFSNTDNVNLAIIY